MQIVQEQITEHIAKQITQLVLKKFRICFDDINSGWCYQWAWQFHKRVGGNLCTVRDFGGHAFVELNGRYYDSDHPKGVTSWTKLKCLGNDDHKYKTPDKMEKMDKEDFKHYWQHGSSGRIREFRTACIVKKTVHSTGMKQLTKGLHTWIRTLKMVSFVQHGVMALSLKLPPR